jgi:hypothetical protein
MTNWNYQKIVALDGIAESTTTILRLPDQANIPPDPANTDYAAYLAWVEAGNTPEPAPVPEPVPELTTEQKLEAAGLTVAELRELFGLPAPE